MKVQTNIVNQLTVQNLEKLIKRKRKQIKMLQIEYNSIEDVNESYLYNCIEDYSNEIRNIQIVINMINI